uniref:Uncharacterized protein n=1 Tax=Lactuca sativa TaxID=4236 RepID=A0A9R1XU74_LACSA|nr:hypothetical protein LSAT_V11C300153160 [Lactuca sativa]
MCPILQEDTVAVKAVGGYQQNFQNNYQQKQQFQPPPGFQQQRNFQQPGFQQNFQNQQNFQHQNFQQPLQHQPSSSNMALEYIVKSLATSTQAFQTETRASIKNLEQQVSQLATSIGRLESQGKLPGHTENNPKHNLSVISLRSRNTYEGPSSSEPENKDEEEFEEVLIEEGDVEGIEKEAEAEEFEEVLVEEEYEKLEEKETPTLPKPILKEYKSLPPFPSRLKSTKRERDDENIMKFFARLRPFMKTAKTKIDVFNGMISMEFDEEVVKFQINNDDFPSDNVSVNYMVTISPLSEGCCEFSNVSVQEKFLNRNSSDNISKELADDKLGEVEEVEMKSATEEESNNNMKRKKLLEKEKVEVVISYTNLKKNKF